MVHLSVTPEVSLADSSVKIYASGLAPSQLVTLYASLTDERGVKFAARAFYQANQNGEVDVAQASALGGNYTGVWPMGLFYCLKAEKMFHRLVKRDVTGSPFYVQISLFNSSVILPLPTEEPLATCTVERWYVAPGVERIPVKSGRVRGALFLPPGPGPVPGLIDMFGGAGGLIEFRAGLLASKGFAVLALAFFAYDDLPQRLDVVDLEYFEEASRLLLKHPKVRGPGLGVIGLSKGGEIALAMGTFLKEILATVCINGPTKMSGTPLHFHDVKIPAVPYRLEKILLNEMGVMSSFHSLGHPLDETSEESIIPVEKAHGHILFVVGEADQSFHSKGFTEAALTRAKKYGKIHCSLLSYPGAGHQIEPPGSPVCYAYPVRFYPLPFQWGGEMKPHAKAQEDSWNEIQNFLKLHLGPVQNSNL
ncbi:bile acid-CoA:amino acid N-acyltransferase isoform X1 [Python bivittatus]|uniref:Bile acid-CoA:amino acid N-acyltransferase isoform X1 n=1 Tax=Python bivittatus TaxID=176946 RepID=A0A9F2QZJ1_PYTBI|nr:bile acid-CoA:amino acid N-acyltransferase isoform X1 [Python bivittatus]XP_015744127.1 bile acid-CoA:amino acid N-acyltransferase isoform X1 [Python bivittatus]XP_025024433.1 bile acid-CoA:amino acid N-acyltransferase isoform X1 [Python bivittatus]XP_025024434.1 bile acid-CoA:amino acid N-acyltransferase isoform X1 [Python bivittatus]